MTGGMPRELMVKRLREDLIGPRSIDEKVRSRPSDVYLTGILWPRNTAIEPEEDEKLSVAMSGEDDGEDAPEQAQPQSVSMRRPSVAGISFAANSEDGETPVVEAYIRFGTYEEGRDEHTGHWARTQHDLGPIDIALKPGTTNETLSSKSVGNLRLNVRTVPFPGGMLSTVTLVNDAVPEEFGRAATEKVTLFQVSLELRGKGKTRLVSRPSRRHPVDAEDWSSALLYSDAHEFAAGHTCSADWTVSDNPHVATSVRTEWIPEVIVPAVTPKGHTLFAGLDEGELPALSARWLAGASTSDLASALRRLCNAYEKWIGLQEEEAEPLKGKLADTARRHLDEAASVLKRMRAGIDFIEREPAAARSFRLANLAMTAQREWSGKGELFWRPFQLGFLLLTIESAADGAHPDRNMMDLLWFPTGGGKTEAYLGLIAFVAFHRRLSRANPDDGAGVAVIMRYTLRLLTTQQFLRAAAMICACEAIRRGAIKSPDASGLGTASFSIGLWVGDKSSPNTRVAAFNSLSDDSVASPKLLLQCPCCSKSLDYQQKTSSDFVTVWCKTAKCTLTGALPLPVWTVDQDVYDERPTLIIGTVDKFAQIVRQPATARLFAVGSSAQPQLVLQDELHLISGPLGTLTGLYESALDIILSAGGTKPKIIGSTATIRRASEQVLALFNRDTCQFPPAGLSADDSGFTVIDEELPGRRYVGVTTAGRSAKFTLQAVAASLLQSASEGLSPEHRDHYWTLVTYFNSLRELGGALVLLQDDVYDSIKLFAKARSEADRALGLIEELTSRRSQKDITGMLKQLAIPAGDAEAIDAVLATSMVSVGVDIDRLGLMLVNGQPKTMAEYIQATSRVGRAGVPGLVVTVLNNAKPRDRSHYETFRTWHSTIYREVEATSVTPFAARARDRALHAVLVAVIRHLAAGMLDYPVLDDAVIAQAKKLISDVAERARAIDPLETDVESELRERLKRWRRREPAVYWDKYKKGTLLQAAEEAAAKRAAGRSVGQAWPTPNTMRGVEPGTHYRLAEALRKKDDAA